MGVDFVYVKGSTLNTDGKAYPILTCGPLAYPSNRPITAVYMHSSGGKLLVTGSAQMFYDDYFELEENQKIM